MNADSPITVSIVEDDRPTRELVGQLIKLTPPLRFLAGYPNAETALESIPAEPPDVLLVDLHLPNLSGVECIRLLKQRLPSVRALVLTKYDEPAYIFGALRAGADGYILKRKLPEEMPRAILAVAQGAGVMSSEVAALVIAHFHQQGKTMESTPRLSPREQEILEHLSKGCSDKEIARSMGIKPLTVNGYLKSIYDKLHVHSRAEAVAKYLKG